MEFIKDDLSEVGRYNLDQAQSDPTVQTISDFSKRLRAIAKQTFQNIEVLSIHTFVFRKQTINFQ